MIVGVFDSGVGGLSVVNAIKKALPGAEVIYKTDKANLPYGNKSLEELLALVKPILESMQNEGCQAIVIACNTVTTAIINKLRKVIKIPLVGMEPMVKPAAEMTKTGVIAVCATPTTLASKRYKWLKETYAQGVEVLEPDCSNWTRMIEDEQVDEGQIKNTINEIIEAKGDVIVLGCTHYHWIEELILEYANGEAKVIQPTEPVINQLKKVLEPQI